MVFLNGDIYEGLYKDGLKHGLGKYTYKSENNQTSVYEGNFISDVKHGAGQLKYMNGEIYEGQFEKDVK